jgi:hypothetical protein
MILYHGTTEIITIIHLHKCRLRTDFGRGFYVSSKLGAARVWAISKAGFSGIPTVMRYEIGNALLTDRKISCLRFDNTSVEWLDFIRDNRRTDAEGNSYPEPRHSFDVVSGPIADDKVADVVDAYCKGRINASEAIARTKALPSVFQLSLHTQKALEYISLVAYSQHDAKLWSAWEPVQVDEHLRN